MDRQNNQNEECEMCDKCEADGACRCSLDEKNATEMEKIAHFTSEMKKASLNHVNILKKQ